MSLFYVLMIERGPEERWPETGKTLIRSKGMDTPVFGWVKAERPEEAVSLMWADLDDDLKARLDSYAQVIELTDQEPRKIRLPLEQQP